LIVKENFGGPKRFHYAQFIEARDNGREPLWGLEYHFPIFTDKVMKKYSALGKTLVQIKALFSFFIYQLQYFIVIFISL
jgi:sensor histidine kinase YesM